LAIAVGAIGMILGLIALTMIDALTTGNVGNFLGTLAILAVLGILLVIIGIIAFVFAMLGLYSMHKGRAEFGADHATSVKKGVNLIIFGIVMQLVAGIAGIFITVGSAFTLDPDPMAMRNSAMMGSAVGGGIGLGAIILYGLGMERILERLMTARARDLRMPFLGVAIAGGATTLALGIWSAQVIDAAALDSPVSFASLASILSIISLYLYHRQLKESEGGARNMIETGVFDPDAPRGAPAPVAVPPPPATPPPASPPPASPPPV
jgi:hypothetical protein